MPLPLTPGQDSIITKIKEIPGIDVIRGEYTSDGYVPTVDANQMFNPYVLVKFNGAFPAYDNGITGPDKDTLRASISVYVVSPDDRTSGLIDDQVREKMLTNFAPSDGSSLKATGAFSFIDADLGYHRYVRNSSYSYYSNLS